MSTPPAGNKPATHLTRLRPERPATCDDTRQTVSSPAGRRHDSADFADPASPKQDAPTKFLVRAHYWLLYHWLAAWNVHALVQSWYSESVNQ